MWRKCRREGWRGYEGWRGGGNGVEDMRDGGPRDVAKEEGYMPQKDLLFLWRTVLENIILPVE